MEDKQKKLDYLKQKIRTAKIKQDRFMLPYYEKLEREVKLDLI